MDSKPDLEASNERKTEVNHIYFAVLGFTAMLMLAIYYFIFKISPEKATAAPDQNVPQREPGAADNDHIEEDLEGNDELNDENEHQVVAAGDRLGQRAKLPSKKKREKMERKQATREYIQHKKDQDKRKYDEEKRRWKEQRKQEKQNDAKLAAEEAEWEEHIRKKQQEEQIEYENWKPTITLEASGSDDTDKMQLWDRQNELTETIKAERVVTLEHLASRFSTATALLVKLIQYLLDKDKLEGIFDERGRFIHVTREERLRIAKIIQQRGRISIFELTNQVNKSISLEPSIAPFNQREMETLLNGTSIPTPSSSHQSTI